MNRPFVYFPRPHLCHRGLGLLLATLLLCRPALAGDAFSLVAQAMRAKGSRTYQARQTIVWSIPPEGGGGIMELVTQTAHQGMRARTTYLFPPDAAGRVMVDDGVQTSVYESRTGRLVLSPSLGREMAADRVSMLALLRRNYQCRILRREPINGRMCAVVMLRLREWDGPYKMCWIDQAHPFVLRLEEYDAGGSRRYVSSYDSISFPKHLPAQALALPTGARHATPNRVRETGFGSSVPAWRAAFAQAGIPVRRPAWLPAGFALLRHSVLAPTVSSPCLVQMRYGDGVRTLTVLQGRADGRLPPSDRLNESLARYGQQAWCRDWNGVRTVVRGDLSLPAALGADLLTALDPQVDAHLARCLVHAFGRSLGREITPLRGQGWNYVEIVSLALCFREYKAKAAPLHALLARGALWPAIAVRLHVDAPALTHRATTWIAATLHP